jgi:hypothetical protein
LAEITCAARYGTIVAIMLNLWNRNKDSKQMIQIRTLFYSGTVVLDHVL